MNKSRFVNILNRNIEIVFHPNRSLIGLKGRVIYESQEIIHLLINNKKIVKVPKKGVVLKYLDLEHGTDILISYKDIKGSIVRRLDKL